MTAKNRPLAKALHTVTVVARVAALLRASDAETRTREALDILGYSREQVDAADPALFAACVAAVQKLSAPLLRSVA